MGEYQNKAVDLMRNRVGDSILNNKIERRAVKTGTVTDEGTAIVAGLSGTERVILRAGGFLNPGDKVRPVLPNKR